MGYRALLLGCSVSLACVVAAGCSPPVSHRATGSAGSGGTMTGAFSETASPAGAAGTSASGDPGGVGAATGAMASGATAGSGAVAASSTPGVPTVPPAAAQTNSGASVGLRAGGVDDNVRFADYLTYVQQFASLGLTAHPFDVSNRRSFTVTNGSGAPVLGADIVIAGPGGKTAAEMRTYADGRALWFPSKDASGPFTAHVSDGSAVSDVPLPLTTRDYHVTLRAPTTASSMPVDIEFVVDATGSMGDEIAALKASLSDISARIDSLPAKPDVRFALTIYRDRVDSFLTRTWNFSSDLSNFQQEIAGVSAAGGGDYPEDVQQGLYDGLHKPDWRGPGTVKLMFLIGDAPPHLDYQNDPDYITTAQQAAADGVKIETLAGSGLDDLGEYVWRQLSELTLGQFLFLTYGPNGGPGDATTHHVTGYTPMNLDDLVVSLVSQELQATGSGSQGPGAQLPGSQGPGSQTPGSQAPGSQ